MKLIEGDDGMPANEVGVWAMEKHNYLCRYVNICREARRKYIGIGKGVAAYFDLFCATGRSRIRSSDNWIEGSAIAAWNTSVAGGVPFSAIYVSDTDDKSLNACVSRLKALNAPVVPIHSNAVEAAEQMVKLVNPHGLYFAFLDPYNLLDFGIIRSLSKLKRIDMLIHLSRMDFQRNLPRNLGEKKSSLDVFAPGWRKVVDTSGSQPVIRQRIIEYWRNQVAGLRVWPSIHYRLITGGNNQPLYDLLLVAGHELAHQFWETAANPEGQKNLF
ncbi:MAG: three-Cys-motif partner protein TcmP [Candidatus Competibacter sp.]